MLKAESSGSTLSLCSSCNQETLRQAKVLAIEDAPTTPFEEVSDGIKRTNVRALVSHLESEGEVEELGQKEASNIIDNILALGGKPEY